MPDNGPPPANNCSGLKFDGSNDWVAVPDVGSTTAQTLEAWIDWTPDASGDGIFRSNCGGVRSIPTSPSQVLIEFFPSCNGTSSRYYGFLTLPTLPSGTFHFAVVTTNGTQATAYVNGAQAGSLSLAFDNGGVTGKYPGALAVRRDTNFNSFNDYAAATFYEVRFSNAAKYTSNFTPAYPLAKESDTEVLYRFDEGTGTSLGDASGNNRDGTINNGATWVTTGCPNSSTPPPAPGQIQKFTASELGGYSVDLKGDNLIIGSHSHNGAAGQAAIYSRNAQGTWALAKTLDSPGPSGGDRFGYAVAMSESIADLKGLFGRSVRKPRR